MSPKKLHMESSLLDGMEYVTWLGKDDLLGANSLTEAFHALDSHKDKSFVFGNCQYIDAYGERICQSIAVSAALSLLTWGPDLVPQPGTVWRQDHYRVIGGIDKEFDMSFDFDLFIRPHKFGGGIHKPGVLSSFRWHRESSSVSRRWDSVIQASRVRRKNRGSVRNFILLPLEVLVVFATWLAGKFLYPRVPK